MNYYIRCACVEDATAICNLNLYSLGYGYSRACTCKKLQLVLNKSDNAVFVAEAQGRVVGYVHACDYDVLYAPSVKNILGLAVEKDYQKMGIGTALLNTVEKWAMQTGAMGVRLSSGATRINAHKFYENRGYLCEKTQLRFIKYFDGIID